MVYTCTPTFKQFLKSATIELFMLPTEPQLNRCLYLPPVKCLRLVTGFYWYVSNRQIHEDLGVQLFVDHISALTASFDSKLADVGNPLERQIGRYLRWPRVDPVSWRESQGRQGPACQSRPSPTMAKSTKRNVFGVDQQSVLCILWQTFSVIFLSCKAIPTV